MVEHLNSQTETIGMKVNCNAADRPTIGNIDEMFEPDDAQRDPTNYQDI